MKLNIDDYYHVELYAAWNNTAFDVKIKGVASINTIKIMDSSVDIKDLYFTQFDMEDLYDDIINPSSMVYLCEEVEANEPLSVKEGTIYIPKDLIDAERSFKYIHGKRLSFIVSVSEREFKTDAELEEFESEKCLDIKRAVKSVDDFSGDTVSVVADAIDTISPKEYYDALEKCRNKAISNKNSAIQQRMHNEYITEQVLRGKIKEYDRLIALYDLHNKEYAATIKKIRAVEQEADNYYATNAKVRTDVTRVIKAIASGKTNPEMLKSLGTEPGDIYEALKNMTDEQLNELIAINSSNNDED